MNWTEPDCLGETSSSYIQIALMWPSFHCCVPDALHIPGAECFSRTPSIAAVTETGSVSASPRCQWWYCPPRHCAGATKKHSDVKPHQHWGMACKWTLHHLRYHISVFYCSNLLISYYSLISSTTCVVVQHIYKHPLQTKSVLLANIQSLCVFTCFFMVAKQWHVFFFSPQKPFSFTSTETLA